jgi:Ca2+-binding EF-hand superfamily protein
VARDLDGDGQLTLSEFAPNATKEDIREFNRLDADHDGVITAKEVLEHESRRSEALAGRDQETAARDQGSGIRAQVLETRSPETGTRGRRSRARD